MPRRCIATPFPSRTRVNASQGVPVLFHHPRDLLIISACRQPFYVTDNVVVVVVVTGSGSEIKLTLWKHLKGHASEMSSRARCPRLRNARKGFFVRILLVDEACYNFLCQHARGYGLLKHFFFLFCLEEITNL